MTTTKKTCSCHPPESGFCCPLHELAVLRETVDQAIRVLNSEVTAPAVIGDEGVIREVARHTAEQLAAVRRSAA